MPFPRLQDYTAPISKAEKLLGNQYEAKMMVRKILTVCQKSRMLEGFTPFYELVLKTYWNQPLEMCPCWIQEVVKDVTQLYYDDQFAEALGHQDDGSDSSEYDSEYDSEYESEYDSEYETEVENEAELPLVENVVLPDHIERLTVRIKDEFVKEASQSGAVFAEGIMDALDNALKTCLFEDFKKEELESDMQEFINELHEHKIPQKGQLSSYLGNPQSQGYPYISSYPAYDPDGSLEEMVKFMINKHGRETVLGWWIEYCGPEVDF